MDLERIADTVAKMVHDEPTDVGDVEVVEPVGEGVHKDRTTKKMSAAKNPIIEAMDAAYGIIDGIDGWMSETGDFPSNFWKPDVLRRYDGLSDVINRSPSKPEVMTVRRLTNGVKKLLLDLVDGLNGVVSEQGEIPDRYWKRNVITQAKKAIRRL